MKQQIKKISLMVILSLLLISCASVPTIEFTVLEPSEIDMSSYKNIAVTSTEPYRGWYATSGYVPFRNCRTHRYTSYNFGWKVSPYVSYNVPLPNELASYANSILISSLYNTNYFTNIISGSAADRIYSSLNVSGVSRENVLRKNNVDAFITSNISEMSSVEYIDVKPVYRYVYYEVGDYYSSVKTYQYDDYEDFDIDEEVYYDYDTSSYSYDDYDEDEIYYFDGSDYYDYDDYYDDYGYDDYDDYSYSYSSKSVSYKPPKQYKRRRVIDHFDYTLYQTVKIALTYSVVDAHTGYTIATKTVRDEYTKSTIIKPYTYTSLSFSPYYKRLLDKMNDSVLRTLAPHKVYKSETLMGNNPENGNANHAYELVENNNLSLALIEFLSVWNTYRHIPSGYNAAIIYFALGEYDNAIDLMTEVYNESRSIEIANKLTEIQGYKMQHDKAKRQM